MFVWQVRFLSDLVNCHVIAAPSMVAMFENFVAVIQEEEIPQVRSVSLCVCVVTGLSVLCSALFSILGVFADMCVFVVGA